MVRASDLSSGSLGFQSRSDHLLVLFRVVPGSTSWPPVEICIICFIVPESPSWGVVNLINLFICEHAIFASTEFSGQCKSTVIHDIKERQTSKNILISPSAAAGGGRGSFNAVIQLHSLCRFSSLFHVT